MARQTINPTGDVDLPDGVVLLQSKFDALACQRLLAWVETVAAEAPLFRPAMPRTAKPISVLMTNAGPLGWVADRSGYRYQATHPETGGAWPSIAPELRALWAEVAPDAAPPEACLINVYDGRAKLGSHRDLDEADRTAPVVSVSLGCDARFHVGGAKRSDPKTRITLKSGDVVVLGGRARAAYHGIDKVMEGTSPLPGLEGRINLTLRRVTVV